MAIATMIHRIMCIRTSRGASPIGPRCRVQHVLSSRSYSATSARLTGQVRDRSHVQIFHRRFRIHPADRSAVSIEVDIIHVKGEGTYGLPRTVPLHPDVREILPLYLILRKKWLVDNNLNSHALFLSKNGTDGYLSGNAIRRIKAVVEDDLNVKFDLRMCRRTFGQRYLDSDVDIESVSVLMGHASTKTTEGFYSRKRLNKAIDNARNSWLSSGGQ